MIMRMPLHRLASVLAAKNLHRWLKEKKELKLRYEKIESGLASIQGQSTSSETLDYQDSKIKALGTNVEEGTCDSIAPFPRLSPVSPQDEPFLSLFLCFFPRSYSAPVFNSRRCQLLEWMNEGKVETRGEAKEGEKVEAFLRNESPPQLS
ncbi:hypothetical protein HAX54_041998 [Datura stramonium]|uniref:Uncharacterized protein n=1 Tax=Datura stramonium TaxID=4076 RepID=A0ABS8SLI0_DATST|nr:hypothetical protein [Datura stramonium]